MRYGIELLRADVVDELGKIDRIVEAFLDVEQRLDFRAPEIPLYDRGAIGYMLHNFYNGCEAIFISIARFFENDIEPQSWHRDLLKRMRLAVEGYRPAVIDEDLFRELDEFRSFRHKFRHSYAFELDWEKMRPMTAKLVETASMVDRQIRAFLNQLNRIDSP